jgi:hypothetical protein
MDQPFTYKGNLEAMQFVEELLENIRPEHKDYQSAPSNFFTFQCGKKYHMVAYHTPKSGIIIKSWADI